MWRNEYLGVLVLLADIACIVLIVYTTSTEMLFFQNEVKMQTIIYYGLVWCGINFIYGIYMNFHELYSIELARKTLQIIIFFFVAVLIIFWPIYTSSGEQGFDKRTILHLLIFVPVGASLSRIFFLFLRKRIRTKMAADTDIKTIIIGDRLLMNTVNECFEKCTKGSRCVGYFSLNEPISGEKESMWLGCVDSFKQNLPQYAHSRIICAIDVYEKDPELQQLLKHAQNYLIKVAFVVNDLVYDNSSLKVGMNRHIPVFSYRREPLEKTHNLLLKRIFDIIVSLIVILCFLSWMIPLIGLLIKLDSPGPIFFRQKRSGYNNKEFICLKFRSMCVNGDADKAQATKNDQRVSRIGKFLRKTNLDEFPQFINVLLGDMSVVGPRPHMLSHTAYYSKEIDKYMVRHFALPGITGYAQVMGARGETKRIEDMQKRVEYDIWYLENWSFFLDIKIILLTAFATFKGDKNAY